uniref:Uncharacterized protein n=1 Tax=Parascaris equorum TaxID=6256 RepID=A0A914RJA7_PAREQ
EVGRSDKYLISQAFESFIFRCPKDIVPFVPEIGKVISEFLKHDPNYTYDDDESEVEEGANMDTDGTEFLYFVVVFD